MDLERQDAFEEAGAHFESRYYLTFVWLPPAEDASRVEGWLYEGRAQTGVDPWELLHGFVDRTNRVLQLVEGFMPEVAWLDDSDTLTYLHSTISTRAQRIRVPETPMHLDALLADEPLAGGLEPRLGAHHLRTLTVVGFPTATHPGILDELNRLAFPYRWSTRAILLDKTEAVKLLTKIRRQWFAKRKSIAAIVKEVMTNEASTLVDSDAANKAADADMALQALGSDDVGQAYVTATVTVWDEDPGLAAEKLRLVEKVIQGRDFTCMPEGVNALEAWLGSVPGHAYANVRQPPVSTLNLAHIIPLSAVWAGPARDEHFQAPPLLFGKTEGSTPFRLSLHVGDVGHTLIVGPTGAGKSVLLSLMAMQFRRYRKSQIFAFDFGGSIRTAAIAMGGDWHDLGGSLSAGSEHSVSLQPLAQIDDPSERAWAAEWVAAILAKEGVTIDPTAKEHVWSALTSLASSPVQERTITGLAVLLQSTALKQALQPYCVGGPSGRLLDAESEQLGSAPVQAFETEGLIGAGAAPAVLTYLFHRIEGRLDGRPTLLIIDEGWLVLDDPAFAQQLREWLKTLRKKNASVVFATQSLSDIDGSNIAPAIVESCPTRIFLPNERAIEPQITTIYRRFGLNDRQIEIIARATPRPTSSRNRSALSLRRRRRRRAVQIPRRPSMPGPLRTCRIARRRSSTQRRIDALRVGDRQAGPVEAPDARDLVLGVFDQSGVGRLLRFEDSVDTLGGNDGLILVGEDERRILPVEHHHIDLLAEGALAVHHVGLGCLVALGQVGLQQADPDVFASVTLRPGMIERLTHRGEALLDILVQGLQELG